MQGVFPERNRQYHGVEFLDPVVRARKALEMAALEIGDALL